MTERAATIPVHLPDGQVYRLVGDINAICEFERVMVQAGFEPQAELARYSAASGAVFSVTRALFWAFAQAHHPDLTLRQAGSLLGLHGPVIGAAVGQVFAAAMPANEGGTDPGNPPPPSP